VRHGELSKISLTERTHDKLRYIEKLRTLPIAIDTKAANVQQYEVSTGVFESFLGPSMKYSCSLFTTGHETLLEAETAMLQQYISRAEIEDGMRILDLGCVDRLGENYSTITVLTLHRVAVVGALQHFILRNNFRHLKWSGFPIQGLKRST
jgi:hypothetical protein